MRTVVDAAIFIYFNEKYTYACAELDKFFERISSIYNMTATC
jgi:hypothetical protein